MCICMVKSAYGALIRVYVRVNVTAFCPRSNKSNKIAQAITCSQSCVVRFSDRIDAV
jgi:hypothetical protein